jgi:flagellar assembly protein FliH
MAQLAPMTTLRAPVITSGVEADGARAVRFDRPLLDLASWGDPRLARHIAEATRAGREQGIAAGYAAGWAQGRRAAAESQRVEAAERAEREEATRRQLAARAQSLLAGLAQTARTLTEQVAPAWDDIVEVLLDGALRIAASSLGRELAAVDAEALEAARTALRMLPAADAVVLHLHPDDAAVLGADVEGLPAGLSIVPDAGVPAGTVVARTPLQTLPVDLKAGLIAAGEVLGS